MADRLTEDQKKILRAVIGRLILLAYITLVTWRVVEVVGGSHWGLIGLSALMIIEGIYRCVKRKGKENKWVCVCILLFLIGSVPQVWILQLEYIEYLRNATEYSALHAIESSALQDVLPDDIQFGPQEWVQIFEQTLILTMILTRVVIPSNNLSHGQHSGLLLLFIAIGSDIVEFFEPFYHKRVAESTGMQQLLLGAWTLAVLQFPLNLTVVRTGARVFTEKGEKSYLADERWSLVVSLIFQEIPFFGLRVYLMYVYKVISYGILFFTVKNAFVIVFQLYRILAITAYKTDKPEDDDDVEADRQAGRRLPPVSS